MNKHKFEVEFKKKAKAKLDENKIKQVVEKIRKKYIEFMKKETKDDRIKRFKECIEKDKKNNVLDMSENNTYPINKDVASEWVNSVESLELRKAAQYFIDHTTHISFKIFKDELKKVVNEFNKREHSQRPYILILHTAHEKEAKSNEWVAKLMYEYYLDPKPYDILSLSNSANIVTNLYDIGIQISNIYPNINTSPDNMVDFLICDDGTFSGGQLTGDANAIAEKTKSTHQPTVHVIVPFYSTRALLKLQGISSNIKIYKSYHMKTMSEKLDDDLSNITINKLEYDTYHKNLCKILETDYTNITCGYKIDKQPSGKVSVRYQINKETEVIPIYFDYRIPDERSVYTNIYNIGLPPKDDKTKFISVTDFVSKLRRFVSNCRKINYSKHVKPKLHGLTYNSTEGTFNLDETKNNKFERITRFTTAMGTKNCIMPFYKNEKVYRYYAAGEIRGYLINVLMEHIDKWIRPKDNDVIVNKKVHDLIYKTVMDEISQSGGNINYYKKYVKYKTKYFKLSRRYTTNAFLKKIN